MILMTQRQFFSLFICCILVVSTQCFDCFACNSVHHENCTMDWTQEEVESTIFNEYIEQCHSLCTQKIGKLKLRHKFIKSWTFLVFKNGTRSVWRYCEVHTFDGCNDQKVFYQHLLYLDDIIVWTPVNSSYTFRQTG